MSTGMAAGAGQGAMGAATQQIMQGAMQNAQQTPMQGQNAQAGGINFPAWLDPSVFAPAAAPTGAKAKQTAQNAMSGYGINVPYAS